MHGDPPTDPKEPSTGRSREDDSPTREAETAPGEATTTRAARRTVSPAWTLPDYRILQLVGRGGMGEVFQAEQLRPVRRTVALKVIKWGMDTREVVARFETERQALALMSHPNIARVLDGGATEEGRPYFVMEYVEGTSITGYSDTNRLETGRRLDLFLQVCDAVQHAHQKGIVHRDLKPSNILVTLQDGRPVPKIIDFGVAKVVGPGLTDKTAYTRLGQMIGTPDYMSPEQAERSAADIDTRTDVYSLGVLLYELLVGTLPFASSELSGKHEDQIRRTLLETDPPRPSTRLSSLGEASTEVARNRLTDAGSLRRRLRGDLDWIVMKALEKDRSRRYPSVSELAADIQRHLRHEPVVAGPPGVPYRIRKFIRRHRLAVAAASLVTVALLIGLAGVTAGMLRAVRAEAEARREAATSEQVREYLVNIFRVADPKRSRGREVTAREILDRGARRIETELAGQPLVQASLKGTMGTVYRNLGFYEQARPLYEAALATRSRLLGMDHPQVAESLGDLGIVLKYLGEYDTALEHLNHALALRERLFGPQHPAVAASLIHLARLKASTSKLDEARRLYDRALAIQEESLGPLHLDVARTLNNLGLLLTRAGDYTEARSVLERALSIKEMILGTEHPEVGSTVGNLGSLFQDIGEPGKARTFHERSLAITEMNLGPDHPDLARSLNALATLYARQGEHDAARLLFERSLAIKEKALGPDHPDVASTLNNLGVLLRNMGDVDAARPLFEQALAIKEKALGPDHPSLASSLANLATLLALMGDHETARPLYERSLEIREEALGPQHPHVARTLVNFAQSLLATGELSRAREMARRALEIREEALTPGSPDLAEALEVYAEVLQSAGEEPDAHALRERAHAIRASSSPAGHGND